MRVLLTILFMTLLVGCRRSDVEEAAQAGDGDMPIKVVVTVPPLAWPVEAIWGDRAEVTVLLPEGASPHGWEATPSQVAAVRNADLFITVEYGSAEQLGIKGNPISSRQPKVFAFGFLTHGVGVTPPASLISPERWDDCGQGWVSWQASLPLDEHPWLSTAKMRTGGKFLSEISCLNTSPELIEAALYQAFLRIEPELEEVEAVQSSVSATGVLIITGHDAWSHFFAGIGGDDVLYLRHDHHDEPSGEDITEIRARASEAERVLVVLDPHEDEPWLRDLAEEVAAATVVLDPVGTRDWLGDMKKRYEAVAAALESLE